MRHIGAARDFGGGDVIHLDPWWNPAVESQASDRAQRRAAKLSAAEIRGLLESGG